MCFAIGAMIVSESKPIAEVLREKPFLVFGLAVFLLFTMALSLQLQHVLSSHFLLEFGEKELVDRRNLRVRVVPYSEIEIFSPPPEELFNVHPTLAELRTKIGADEHISVACRLRGNVPDFMFFEKVAPIPYEAQQEIVRHLRVKIATFDHLVDDAGDDVGPFDETNA